MEPKNTSGAAFRAETFPFVDAVYSDAFCLTGSPEAAADLVVAAYVRASRSYDQFRRRRTPESLRSRSTLAWLFGNLHAAFSARVLARADVSAHADRSAAPMGERSC